MIFLIKEIFLFSFSFFFLAPPCAACSILVPQPGIEPVPPVVEVQSPNHWTARDFSRNLSFLWDATCWEISFSNYTFPARPWYREGLILEFGQLEYWCLISGVSCFLLSHYRISDGGAAWLEITQDRRRETSQVQTQWKKSCCWPFRAFWWQSLNCSPGVLGATQRSRG